MIMYEKILDKVKRNGSRWVDLNFVDIDGRVYTKTIHVNELNKETFKEGIKTNLIDVFGFSGKDTYLKPDPSTYSTVPWNRDYVRFISNIMTSKDEHFSKDTRYSMDRVYINLKSKFDIITIKSSIEFYVFDSLSVDRLEDRGALYNMDSVESPTAITSIWNSDNGSFQSSPKDMFYPMRAQLGDIMENNFSYRLEHHEHGSSSRGQQRVGIAEMELKRAADAFISLKYIVKNLAFLATKYATFMPLPLFSSKGNGVKVEIKIKKGNKEIFEKEQEKLYFIGGILEHARALSLFTNPNINSYKRLKKEPFYIAYSNLNNNAIVSSTENSVVFNSADSSINPYLAYAMIIAAGMDGIKKKIQPPDIIEENINLMSQSRKKELKIKNLPINIINAIDAFDSDPDFIKGYISYELLGDYLERKIEEHKENEKRPTPYEVSKYFDI